MVDRTELVRRIGAAFADVPPPKDDNIICHECDECFRLYESLRGHTAGEISDAWIEENFDKLPLLTDDAKRFFLPAFLRVAALKPDSLVAQFVLYSLADDFRMQPSGGYSARQKQAVRDYLIHIEPRMGEYGREYFEKASALWPPVA